MRVIILLFVISLATKCHSGAYEPTVEEMRFLWLKVGDAAPVSDEPDFPSIIKNMTSQDKEEVRKLMTFLWSAWKK